MDELTAPYGAPVRYPAARERPALPAAGLTDRFERVETTRGFVTLGDTDAEVINFSGTPNRIEVLCELFDAILTPRARGVSEIQTITMRAGQSLDLDLGVSVLVARNAVAGSNARLQVIGRY